MQKKKRILFFDVLKSVSGILMTIFHSTLYQQKNKYYYKQNNKKGQYFINCCYVSLTRTCSPLFMMVTGCLLLSPKRLYDKPSVHRKYYFKRLISYLFWVFPFYYDEIKMYDWENNKKQSLTNVIFKYVDSTLMFWYIKILLIIHIITPAVQSALRRLKRIEMDFLLLEYFIIYFYVNHERLLNRKKIYINDFGTLFFSFILGPYLFQNAEYASNPSSPYVSEWIKGDSLFHFLNKIDITKRKSRYILFIIILFIILYGAFCDYFLQMHLKINGLYFIEVTDSYNVILTLFIFLFFFSCFRKWEPSKNIEIILSKFFYSSGSCSMGIYMLNEFVTYRLMYSRIFPLLKLDWYGMNTFLFGPLMGTFSFVVCWRLSIFIKKIPILKNVIY